MRIENINSNTTFKGPLDGVITRVLRTCDMNEMVNAVGLDVGAMVIPRAYYDTKKRNEYAGAETFFREISGTIINCLSAGIFAAAIAPLASKHIMKNVAINANSWYSEDSLNTLKSAWGGDIKNYVNNVFTNLSGRDGKNVNKFSEIDWKNIEWIDEKRWNNIKWKNSKFDNIQNRLKTETDFVNTMTDLINDEALDNSDKKNVLSIMEKRLANALRAERDTEINIGKNKLSAKLENILRDIHDMGKDILKKENPEQIINKIKRVNKIKAFGAITASCVLGLTNQYINRRITEKRTGKKGFVGDVDFTSEHRAERKPDNMLWFKKIGASALMIAMVFSVMGVKNFKQFAKKLEFTGPITSGNAIKTVYAANITGRFLAADNGTELRESMTRDYLGFLNWLVFGGFAAKGVANLIDRKGKDLFNYSKEGKGLKHWLNNMTLKTHNEIAAKGKRFAKKNMWKINLAQASGIAYSAVTLGLLLPMLNAKVTAMEAKKNMQKTV